MSSSVRCVLVSVLLLGACRGLGVSLDVSEDQGLGHQRTFLQISHSESGTLDVDHDHDHHEGEDDGSFPMVHEHDPQELPADHLIEVFGGNGMLFESELDALIHVLNVECGVSENPHSHKHRHEHELEEPEAAEIMTAHYLAEKYGHKGILDSDGLLNACPDILRCQLDDYCRLSETIVSDEDENVTKLKILAASIFVVETVIGTILPMILGSMTNFRIWLTVLNCFSGGVFLAAGFLHMIPHILEHQSEVDALNEYPLGPLLVVMGFILVLFFEHVLLDVQYSTTKLFSTTEETCAAPQFHHISQPRQEPPAQPQQAPKEKWSKISHACVILIAISVHALLEALALGLEQTKSGVLLLLATVGTHKGVVSMALSARFVQSGAPKMQICFFMGLFAAIAPIGIGIGFLSEGVGPLTLVIMDSISAGSFIYVGAYEVISEEFPHAHIPNENGTAKSIRAGKFMSVVSGILVVALLQLIPHE